MHVGMHVVVITHVLLTMRNSIPTITLSPKPLSAAFPEITGLGFPFVLSHVPLDVATLASEAQPSVHWAGKPSNIAGSLPLPSAWIALACGAVQVAFLARLVKPMPCPLLRSEAAGAGDQTILSGSFMKDRIVNSALTSNMVHIIASSKLMIARTGSVAITRCTTNT